MKNHLAITTPKGFTLIELSIVLGIVAILVTTVLSGASSFVQRARFDEAERDLKQITTAMVGFLLTNDRLPCPDIDAFPPPPAGPAPGARDGFENYNNAASVCFPNAFGTTLGYVPATTLGVQAIDPWGMPYFYRVDPNFADALPAPGSLTFGFGDNGDLVIVDGNNNEIAGSVPNAATDDMVLVVFSTGPNRRVVTVGGANPPLDDENIDGDQIFRKANIVLDASSNLFFDDVIRWVSPNILKAKMVEADKLP